MKIFARISLTFAIFLIFVISVIVALERKLIASSESIPLPPITPIATPTPSLIAVHSPDGSKEVIMRTMKINNGIATTYSFFTADIEDRSEQLLFINTISNEKAMQLPSNAWSPNNKYLYLRETELGMNHFLVFQANGQSFQNNQQFLDVTALFDDKQTGNVFNTITGWDSYTLLHVLTKKQDGTIGQSYWFDILNQSFIPLANY